MAQFANMFEVDLNNRSYPVSLVQTVSEGNVYSNRIGAYVYKDGAPVNLGGACTGLVMRADGTTVPMTGVIDGNAAYVVLNQESCAIPGPIQVAVSWVSGNNTTTLLVAYGTVITTDTRSYVQSGPIADVNTLLGYIGEVEQAAADAAESAASAAESAETAQNKCVRFDTAQSLTTTQKSTARGNIDAAGLAQVVRYDSAQTLTDAQKSTARENIDAAGLAQVVRHDASQNLTETQKTTARGNIDAADSAFVNQIYAANKYSIINNPDITGLEKILYFKDARYIIDATGITNDIAFGVTVKHAMYKLSIKPMFNDTQTDQSSIDQNKTYNIHWWRYRVTGKLSVGLKLLLVDQGTIKINDYLTLYNVGTNDIIAFDVSAFTIGGNTYNWKYVKNTYYGIDGESPIEMCSLNTASSTVIKARFDTSMLLAVYKYVEYSEVVAKSCADAVNHMTDISNSMFNFMGVLVTTSGYKFGYKFLNDVYYMSFTPEFSGTAQGEYTVSYYTKHPDYDGWNSGDYRYEYVCLKYKKKVKYGEPIIFNGIKENDYFTIESDVGIKYVSPGDTTYPSAISDYISTQLLYYDRGDDYGDVVAIRGSISSAMLCGKYVFAGFDQSKLYNAKIACIGDSITEYNFRAGINWVMYIENWGNCTIQNLGESGKGFINSVSGVNYNNKIELIDPDTELIGVACSFNDLTTSMTGGIQWDTTEGQETGAQLINNFFDALIGAFPTTPIVCYCEGPWENARPGIAVSDGYIACVKKCCIEHGIPFYDDLYYGTVLRPWIQENRVAYFKSDNYKDYPTRVNIVDNVHPNSKGHLVIAKYIMDKFSLNIARN